MRNENVAVDSTVNGIDTTITHPNEHKVVINHVREYDPNYGDPYEGWKRTETITRHNGSVTVNQLTKTYIPHKNEWRTVNDFSHTFELADDNETIPHSGKEWKTHYIEQSNKGVNLRWKFLNSDTPKSAKDIVKEKIKSEI